MGTLIFLLILGGITAAIAAHKGRNVVGWFFIGFLLGLIGLIIILCMSNLEEERAQQERMHNEQRRLRERLRQEQLKNEAFRQHAARRLDAHDNQLGMDTRPPAQAALADGGFRQGTLPTPQTVDGGGFRRGSVPMSQIVETGLSDEEVPADEGATPAEDALWFYEINGQTHGPEPSKRVLELLQMGEISRHTLLCEEGTNAWVPLRLLPSFRDAGR